MPAKYFIVFTASGNFNVLKCHISFFRFSLPVTGTAENCILTIYPHLAAYLNNNPILYEYGKLPMTIFFLTYTVYICGTQS